MAADLLEMQENQGFSENLIDKLEFTNDSCFSDAFPNTRFQVLQV